MAATAVVDDCEVVARQAARDSLVENIACTTHCYGWVVGGTAGGIGVEIAMYGEDKARRMLFGAMPRLRMATSAMHPDLTCAQRCLRYIVPAGGICPGITVPDHETSHRSCHQGDCM